MVSHEGPKRVPNGTVPPRNGQQNRSSWDVHREQVRRTNRARYRAVDQLIEEHQDEYVVLHRTYGALQDPPVYPYGPLTPQQEARDITNLIARLQQQLDELEDDGE